MEDVNNLIGKRINNKILLKYISRGAFGAVFQAQDVDTKKFYAIKIPIKNDTKDGTKLILDEQKIYKGLDGSLGIATSTLEKTDLLGKIPLQVMVMDLLGDSLEQLRHKQSRKKFRLKTVILLAIQILDIIREIHDRGYIHRDIKPDNFVVGYEKQNSKIFCIDFGISIKKPKKYKTSGSGFCGTARYASLVAHRGGTQYPGSDLESIGYMLVYLFKGELPWDNIKNKDKKEKYKLIMEKKESITEEELCKGMPKEFSVYLRYTKNLGYNDPVHYNSLKKMFVNLYESRGYANTNFEWV